MKKLLAIVLIIAMLIPAACAEIDLSGMSYDELVALKDKINLALWATEEWQEVLVPQGVYQVGVDIPAGVWTITAVENLYSVIIYGSALCDNGWVDEYSDVHGSYQIIIDKGHKRFRENQDFSSINIELTEGFYIQIQNASAIFTTYTGRPELGFRK